VDTDDIKPTTKTAYDTQRPTQRRLSTSALWLVDRRVRGGRIIGGRSLEFEMLRIRFERFIG